MNHRNVVVDGLIKFAWDNGIVVTPEMLNYLKEESVRILNNLKNISNKNINVNEARDLANSLLESGENGKVSSSRVLGSNKVWCEAKPIQRISKRVGDSRNSEVNWRVRGVRRRV